MNPLLATAGSMGLKAAAQVFQPFAQTAIGNMTGRMAQVGLPEQQKMMDVSRQYSTNIDELGNRVYDRQRDLSREAQADGMRSLAFRNRITQDLDNNQNINSMARDNLQFANQNAQQLANNYLQASQNAAQLAASLYGGRL